jgi:hypothetical protein
MKIKEHIFENLYTVPLSFRRCNTTQRNEINVIPVEVGSLHRAIRAIS